jgi:coenzyme F420-reducing hydrogenase delta subunit
MNASRHQQSKILILATLSGGYVGADGVGQLHVDYAPNTYILPVVCASMFPVDFYIRSFEKGIDAIIVMYSGSDCPYKDGAAKTAEMINRTYERMKELTLDTSRLRLTAICTVCTTPFQREIKKMEGVLAELGPINRPILETQAV